MKLMSATYLNSLMEVVNKGEDLDLVISTRFDINFFKNPFKEYQYDFNKCNFLWREPEYLELPIVNDTNSIDYKKLANINEIPKNNQVSGKK